MRFGRKWFRKVPMVDAGRFRPRALLRLVYRSPGYARSLRLARGQNRLDLASSEFPKTLLGGFFGGGGQSTNGQTRPEFW